MRSEAPVQRIAADEAAQDQRNRRKSGRPERDPRAPARRDRDKLLYASSLQRLTGVTQVVTPEPGGALTHNRLTHSLKVAQVARSVAEVLLNDAAQHTAIIDLGGLDADVAEAAALAHDLGHPPFGHIGETTLDRFARRVLDLPEGFEGNAQSFRIVARLDCRSPAYDGSDLTAATRGAILKYPWARTSREARDDAHARRLTSDRKYSLQWRKFGYYTEEQEDFDQARAIPGVAGDVQSLEAAIMDLADDVTYALHDLQDFYFARVLPVPAVLSELRAYGEQADRRRGAATSESPFAFLEKRLDRDYPGRFDRELYIQAVRQVRGDLSTNFAEYYDATPDTTAVVAKFVSRTIGELTKDLVLNVQPTGQKPAVMLADLQWHRVQVFKYLTHHTVIARPDIAVYQRAQQDALRELLGCVHRWWRDDEDAARLPQPLRGWRQQAREEGRDERRCLVDFIASLSDHQAMELRRALRGGSAGMVTPLVL